MAYFFCDKCSRLVPLAGRATHRAGHDTRRQWSPHRDQAAHKRFARAVKKRDGHRCVVCGSGVDVRAAHVVSVANGGSYDPSNGRTLCRTHDMAVDAYAR